MDKDELSGSGISNVTESESVTIASEIVSNLVNNGDKIDTTVAATTDEVEAFISPTFKVSL